MKASKIMNVTRTKARKILKEKFGFDKFYDEQWKTIENILNKQRVLLIHRTGFGKSLCYQFPAILFEGITLVFSPLIALMRDQVKQLKANGIAAECINSEQSKEENRKIIEKAKANKLKILYVAPERQDNKRWMSDIKKCKLSLITIDEAHCISIWGHDFRPAFRRIINLMNMLPKNIPVLATTATATEKAVQDIIHQIGGKVTYLRGNLMRENFRLNVEKVSSEDDKFAFMGKYLPRLNGTGIIYAGTRINTELYTKFLIKQGIDTVNYNAGLSAERRIEIEKGLLNNRWKCVVATNALGMGFDKPDIRFIIHTQFPESPMHYYQEIGRAGRDGKVTRIILLYNPEDRDLPEYFIKNSRPSTRYYMRVINELKDMPLSRWDLMRRTNLNRNKIEVIVNDLIEQKIIEKVTLKGSHKYQYKKNAPNLDTSSFDELRKYKQNELEKMVEYAEGNKCRMLYLCNYLQDKNAYRCGKCDICRSKELIFQISPRWEKEVKEFKENDHPELEFEYKSEKEKPISERRNKLVNGVAYSYYGFSHVGSLIHKCKYENGGDFPDSLVKGVVKAYEEYFIEKDFDLIIYVPPTESGELVKNFAEKISNILSIPLSEGLTKIRNTKPQKIFQNYVLKKDNVKDSFDYIDPEEIKEKNILLIDDICDSKATIREIGKMLGRYEVRKVAPLVIAKTIAGDTIFVEPDSKTDRIPKNESFAGIRKDYPNAYKKWTEKDDKLLVEMSHQGKSVKELAEYFGRRKGAIRSRLKKNENKKKIEQRDFHSDLYDEGTSKNSDKFEENETKPEISEEDEISKKLRKWRYKRSQGLDLPAYCIFPNSTLTRIAEAKPETVWDLLDIKGLGKILIKKYGKEILEITNNQDS